MDSYFKIFIWFFISIAVLYLIYYLSVFIIVALFIYIIYKITMFRKDKKDNEEKPIL